MPAPLKLIGCKLTGTKSWTNKPCSQLTVRDLFDLYDVHKALLTRLTSPPQGRDLQPTTRLDQVRGHCVSRHHVTLLSRVFWAVVTCRSHSRACQRRRSRAVALTLPGVKAVGQRSVWLELCVTPSQVFTVNSLSLTCINMVMVSTWSTSYFKKY